jgi:hypothetical protein
MIRFCKPGRGRVCARFVLTEDRLDEIRRAADAQDKVEPVFTVQVLDDADEVVAEVEKLLYVRRKDRARAETDRP